MSKAALKLPLKSGKILVKLHETDSFYPFDPLDPFPPPLWFSPYLKPMDPPSKGQTFSTSATAGKDRASLGSRIFLLSPPEGFSPV